MRQLVQTMPISKDRISLTFAAALMFVDEPAVLVTVHGGVTEVDVQFSRTQVEGLGMLYTGVTLTFQPTLVGRRVSVVIFGE
jgi:hypothetical protein